MSDTRRRIEPNPKWQSGHPVFEEFNDYWSRVHKRIASKKHQAADHSAKTSRKNHVFINGIKNSIVNLRKKVDDLRLKEALDLAEAK